MSADLEVLLNDLVMKAERTNAEFRQEMGTSKRIEEVLERVKYLNAMTINEALSMLQFQPVNRATLQQPMPAQSLPTFPQAWN